jgi:hypothetical protein
MCDMLGIGDFILRWGNRLAETASRSRQFFTTGPSAGPRFADQTFVGSINSPFRTFVVLVVPNATMDKNR